LPVDRARHVLTDPEAARRLLERVKVKAKEAAKKAPKQFWDQVSLLRRMVAAYVKGEYRDFPVKTVLFAIAALLYFVNPFDLIPDWLGVLGLLDDASVIAFVINSAQTDITKFKKWEATKSKPVRGKKPTRRGTRRRRSPTAA